MTRDFNLFRTILLQVEASTEYPVMFLSFPDAASAPADTVLTEHIELLIEDGYIEGKVIRRDPATFAIKRLTSAGHDFLEKSRNETVWKKALASAKKLGGVASLELFKAILKKAIE